MIIVAYKNRALVKSITIKDSAGTAITFGSGDTVRLKVGKAGETPLIEMSSSAATGHGSTMTAANPTTAFFHQNELHFAPGVYDLEVSLVDHSQSDAIKVAEYGVFVLHDVQLGTVTV